MERRTVGPRGLTSDGQARMRDVMAGHVEEGGVPGLAWLVTQGDSLHAGTAGTLDLEHGNEVQPDRIFRISSMTKPVIAVAALILVEECSLRLDEPVDPFCRSWPTGGCWSTRRPARRHRAGARPITVRDVLTFRLGLGMDFTAAGSQPVLAAMAELGLAGPPAPKGARARRVDAAIGRCPLDHQPGERWLYHTGADVLGVLVARVAGQPLRRHSCASGSSSPWAWWTPVSGCRRPRDRFGPVYGPDPAARRPCTTPPTASGPRPPPSPSGGAGLVSTSTTSWPSRRCCRGGTQGGPRILARPSVEVMTTNQLTAEQLATRPDPSAGGLGLRRGRPARAHEPARRWAPTAGTVGSGRSWANDPVEDIIGVLLTNQDVDVAHAARRSASDFWTCAYGALA